MRHRDAETQREKDRKQGRVACFPLLCLSAPLCRESARRTIPCPRGGTIASRRGGWIVIESFTAIVLLGMLAGAWLVVQKSSAALNEVQLARQRCILAAQAQLESLTATGAAIEDPEVERCWPGVRTQIARRPGEGDWQGLTLVTVSAATQAAGRTVRVDLSRYLPPEGKPEGNAT